jgi:heme-degrading monooxygenase HmoA
MRKHASWQWLGMAVFGLSIAVQAVGQTELGITHIAGNYAFTDHDFLNEGAIACREIGARCIKVALSLEAGRPPSTVYPFHSSWPEVSTLAELADTPYFRKLFSRDFDTFIIWVFRPGRSGSYWRDGFTAEDERAEDDGIAALTRYLLRTYGDTHRTFVLTHWEGDWAIRTGFHPEEKPTARATDGMIRWLRARQRGVARARAEFPKSRAHVYHAAEVNLVANAMERGWPSVTTDVLPHVDVDLVSYSAWDSSEDPEKFRKSIAFIRSHKTRTEPFGERGVYIGEFGVPEAGHAPEEVLRKVRSMIQVAREERCPYAVYWQLYCNEPIRTPARANADYRGFWLIRPDGSRSPVCELFRP